MHSEASWCEDVLPDEMDLTHATPNGVRVPVDASIWSSLSPEYRKNKMKALAWRRFDDATSVGSSQEDADFSLSELSRMSAPLRRWVMWLTRTSMKSLAIPAYSRMSDHILQAASPEVDMSQSMADSPELVTSQPSAQGAFSALRQNATIALDAQAVNERADTTADPLGSRNLLKSLLKKFNCNFGTSK